jgi:hypothetical protein
VCAAPHAVHFAALDDRDYWRCPHCEATFLDRAQLPSRAVEHAYYLTHRNDVDDPRYRRFLSPVATALLERLAPASSGLDYGCGPAPALAAMLAEAGHRVAFYDPLFRADAAVLAHTYDFVACTETAEHFHRPREEFERLDALMNPGGWLAVMTRFQTDDAAFARWHYRRDPTHVVFYREATLRAIAARHAWRCEIPCADVALLRKELR